MLASLIEGQEMSSSALANDYALTNNGEEENKEASSQ
jgi:hypothetical protein